MRPVLDRLPSAGAAEACSVRQIPSATGGVQQRLARLVGARPGCGLQTLAEAVAELLARATDFSVVYQPRLSKITGGPNFFLGKRDGPA